MQQLSCGECGSKCAYLFTNSTPRDSIEQIDSLCAKCTSCGQETDFVMTKPKLEQNGDGGRWVRRK